MGFAFVMARCFCLLMSSPEAKGCDIASVKSLFDIRQGLASARKGEALISIDSLIGSDATESAAGLFQCSALPGVEDKATSSVRGGFSLWAGASVDVLISCERPSPSLITSFRLSWQEESTPSARFSLS